MRCWPRPRRKSTTTSGSFRLPRQFAGRWSPSASRGSQGTATRVTRSRTWSIDRAAETDMTIPRDKRLPFPRFGADPQSVRHRVEAMERLLERLSIITGLNRPIGLDVILDLVPGIGDIAGAALGSYIVWEARNVGMSKWQISRMAGNVGFDWLLGLIPWVGASPDFFFRSNTRNLRMIKRHLDKHHASGAVIDVKPTIPTK